MEELSLPLPVHWNNTNKSCATIVATPDNGLLYLAGKGNVVVYIPKDNFLNAKKQIYCSKDQINVIIDCDSDWSKTKYFALFDHKLHINLWNVDTMQLELGHRGHKKQESQTSPTLSMAMCITKSRKVLSIYGQEFINYCIESNTYTVTKDVGILKHNIICIMKGSTYDDNIFAAGTIRGLVVVASVKNCDILYRLRGHDREITSIDWISVKLDASDEVRPKKKATSRQKPLPIMDSSDIFDIYSYDYLENEFGTLTREKYEDLEKKDAMAEEDVLNKRNDSDNFDFIEACESLKLDIIKKPNDKADEDETIQLAENDESIDPISTELLSDEYEHCDETTINDSCFLDQSAAGDFSKRLEDKATKKHFLASGSGEKDVWIWDCTSGESVHKIQFTKTSKLPTAGISLCWINENCLISTDSNGSIVKHKINFNGKKFSCVQQKLHNINVDSMLGLSKVSDGELSYIWSYSVKNTIFCMQINTATEESQKLIELSTLPSRVMAIEVCPHDMNVIAFAGINKRIDLLTVSQINANNIELRSSRNQIHAKILALDWHPIFENIIAFSTAEGRVGILDITKASNIPINMKPFTGKEVYQISWGFLRLEHKAETGDAAIDECVLFACSKGKLYYFPSSGQNKHSAIPIKDDQNITAVRANANYLAVGTDDGYICLSTLSLQKIWSKKISAKYISECAWSSVSKNRLAVSSMEKDVYLFDCENGEDVKEIGILNGHADSVCHVKWSNESEHKLVSCGYDKTVRVWNTETMACISLYQSDGKMFVALFSPIDENFVFCSGEAETIRVFDVEKHKDNKLHIAKHAPPHKIKLATLFETDAQKLLFLEKRKNRKAERKLLDKDLANLTEALQEIELDDNGTAVVTAEEVVVPSNKVIEPPTLRFNFSTILNLSNREFNRDALKSFAKQLESSEDVDDLPKNETSEGFLNNLLFSTRADAKQLLDKELQSHIDSNTDSIGHILIPLIACDLKADILEKMTAKKLTEQHIAVAPMISYAFWQNCCKAYALQCIEKGWILQSIPYLLSCHQIDEAIETLCDGNFYREAWLIGKINRDDGDQIFEDISNRWIAFLEKSGFLEGAALIASSTNKHKLALEILTKRRNKTEEIEKIIELLQRKI